MNNEINTSFNTLMKNPDGSPIEISINSTTKKSKVTINTLNKTLSATKKKNSQKITYEEKESRKYRRVTLNYDANHIPTSLILDIATFKPHRPTVNGIIRITYNLISLKGVFKVELLSRKGVKNHYAHQISYTIPYNLKELETLLLNLKYPLFKDLDDSLFQLCSIPEEFKILNNLKNILNPEEEEIIGNTLQGFNKTSYCRIRKN